MAFVNSHSFSHVYIKIVVILYSLCMFKGITVYYVRLPRNSVSA